jgi:hypothetical protein
MKVLYSIAALALMSGSAQAWDIYTTCSGNRYFGSYYNSTCRTSVLADRPRNYAQEAADEKARQERVRKWEAFCKPTRIYDNLGVARLTYTKAGCEFGRSE